MKKHSLAFILAISFLWGCASEETPQAVTPTPTPNRTPESVEKTDNTEENETSGSQSDMLASSNTGSTPSGLIPATDADQRLKQVQRGKSDPFAVLPPPQAVINIQQGGTNNNGNNNSATRAGDNNNSTSSDNTKNVVSINDVKTIADVNACGASSQNQSSQAQSSPNPKDAKAVLVSGVMQIDGDNVAIVKTPEYDYSYPIRQGNYIANGLVLVKNIDSLGPEPVVVFEQYGQEVIRRVGQEPELPSGSGGNTSDTQLPFTREQLNVINNEVKGLVLTSIEDIAVLKVPGTDSQLPQEVMEISGFICNITNKPITVSFLSIGFNTENISLPPLNAYFQGTLQGDIAGDIEAGAQARVIQPNRKTLFRGTVANSQVFNTKDKIDVILSSWE